MKRVVVTGMAGITSLGETADDIFARFEAGKSGIRYMPEWEQYVDLRPSLLGLLKHFIFQNILTVRLPVVWGV